MILNFFGEKNFDWRENFTRREAEYIENILWGLEYKGCYEEPNSFIGLVDGKRAIHISEPFIALNYLGFMSPSNITLVFKDDKNIEFWESEDNGRFADNLLKISQIPIFVDKDTDFNHFIENTKLDF